MDPLAHTLVGATLAETDLKKASPLATATLLIGANAPDIDIVSQVGGTDASLYWRRGLTHGVVAMVVLPVALVGVMMLWDRAVRRRVRPGAAPARPGPLLALALLSVLTHPVLDWMNTYGVRLLMPFDDRWFYGDGLYIVDPWVWLLMVAAVVLGRTRGKPSAAAFVVLGCAASAVVLLPSIAPLGAKVAWTVGVAVIVVLRVTGRAQAHVPQVARACVAVLGVYIGVTLAGSTVARADATAWLAERGIHADEAAAGPVPGNPFAREVIVRAGDTYHFVERSWLGGPTLRFAHASLPVGPRGPVARAALASPQVRGMRQWLRFPRITVDPTPEGPRVTIEDVRYSRRDTRIGVTVVDLDHALRPR
jgi:inner membrane protein